MTTNAPRAPIDFDAIERDLHQPAEASAAAPSSAPAPAKADPLAELARIVGQDDPFRALLDPRTGSGGLSEPAKASTQAIRSAPSPYDAPAAPSPASSEPTPADAFDQYLASVERDHHAAHDAYQNPAAFEADEEGDRNAAIERPRGRHRLLQVGAGLGILALCVGGAFAWKSMGSGSSNGEPVTVLADKTPLKVAPEAADGVEIPDQNKQIYERNAKDGQVKVVNREEQPIDVSQATRSASREGSGQTGVTPGSTGLLTESLGEPRRIRTVAVKPDTPPPAMQQQQQRDAEASQPPVSPIPTMVMPDASGSTATPAAAPRRATRSPASNAASAAAQTAEAPSAEEPAAAPSTRNPPQRVATVAPETTASASEPPASAPAIATTASVGGFAVQIGVRNSEEEARVAFRQMQAKFSQLAGKPELIRQAAVNGKTIYRVRVGPLAKGEATSLCSQLKSAGGQCFVAAN